MNQCNERAVVRTYTVNLVTSGKGRKTTEMVVIVDTANSIFLERKLSLQAKPTELPSFNNPVRGWRRWQAQICT
jgi:GH15 family glucan-1,4-alpha-glucosidase